MSSESRSYDVFPDSLIMAILHDLRQLGQALIERFNKLSEMLRAVSGDVVRLDEQIRNANAKIAILEGNSVVLLDRVKLLEDWKRRHTSLKPEVQVPTGQQP